MQKTARTALVLVVAALALLVPASAPASVTVEKTLVVQSAPHGGVTPTGTIDVGSSIQELHVRIPARARDCTWTLTDPATGRMPGPTVFGTQTWQLLFAGLFRKGDWGLTVRVVNPDTTAGRLTTVRWHLLLRCATPPRPPSCYLQALTVPQPNDYVSVGFHCRATSSRFRVTLPRGYTVRALLVADNSYLHEAMSCHPSGRTLSCRGKSPADTTTWLGFFVNKPLKRGAPFSVSVPHQRAAKARTRRLSLRF